MIADSGSAVTNQDLALVSRLAEIESAHAHQQGKPRPPFALVDPVLNRTGRGAIVVAIADFNETNESGDLFSVIRRSKSWTGLNYGQKMVLSPAKSAVYQIL